MERIIAIDLEVKIAYTVTFDKYGVEVALGPNDYKTSPRVLSHDQLLDRIKNPVLQKDAK